MRLKSLFFLIAFTSSLLLQVGAIAQIDHERKSALISDSVPDTLRASIGREIKTGSPKAESPYYRIEIKDDRTYDNFFSRKFLYNPKNIKSDLIGWNKHLPSPFAGLYTSIIEKAFRFPIIFIFLALILAFAGNVLFVIAVLFITNRMMNFKVRQKRIIRALFEKILTDLMLQVTDIPQTIRRLSKSKLKKHYNLLIDVMMDFQKSFRGDSDRQIMELYQRMNLSKISYNKIYSISFYEQVKGLRELTNMKHHQATEMIVSKLNDPIDIVRTEAQICYPIANPESPFDFLGILEKPFSKWAQLNIYYSIKIHEMPVPSFDKWINSTNPNVVNFCILMIDLFQQQDNSEHIIRLLNATDETTRNMAISACGNLHLFDSKGFMKLNFQSETLKNQIEITKVFNLIGDETDIGFIETIIQNESITLRLEAIRALYNLGEIGKAHLSALNHSVNFLILPYISQIQDNRN